MWSRYIACVVVDLNKIIDLAGFRGFSLYKPGLYRYCTVIGICFRTLRAKDLYLEWWTLDRSPTPGL